MSLLTLLVISLLSGSLIKLTDDIEDKNLSRKIYAIPVGLAYGLLIGYLMISDTSAALLFGGIVLGNLVTGKINSRGHYSGLGAILAVFFLYGAILSPLVLLIAAFAALDELGDLIQTPKFMDFIFKYRLILKLGILVLVILNMLGLSALLVLLAFDAAYMLTGGITGRAAHEI
ncbi:MAG: hypothetical protein O8C64_03700 [Candidatus Methanoperedens sp.]|nr:hypothetical protein [Candidatus Methanoperedens sp.]MCZ7403679.1 hypothetical protein [Candidatus Methanoperedens sp.]